MHHLTVYADNINLLHENINTIKKNTRALLDTSKKVDLEVNPEKTKYTVMSHHTRMQDKIISRSDYI
jgi:hypothetical protein